jgi:hypothetical protein
LRAVCFEIEANEEEPLLSPFLWASFEFLDSRRTPFVSVNIQGFGLDLEGSRAFELKNQLSYS